MKIARQLAIPMLLCAASCTKAPEDAQTTRRIEERLERIEAQLAKIEAGLPAPAPETERQKITIYVSGEVAKPGRYEVERDISLLAALSVAGGPTDYADLKKTLISRAGVEDRTAADKNTYKDVVLGDGDVVVIPKSFW